MTRDRKIALIKLSRLMVVILGGSIGASLRFLIAEATKNCSVFFLGTFMINILGSLFIGIISYLAIKMKSNFSTPLKLFLTTGIAGGFTTFSTFNYEIFKLFKSHEIMLGFSYMFMSLFLGLFSVVVGIFIAKGILAVTFEPKFEFQYDEALEMVEEPDIQAEFEDEKILESVKD